MSNPQLPSLEGDAFRAEAAEQGIADFFKNVLVLEVHNLEPVHIGATDLDISCSRDDDTAARKPNGPVFSENRKALGSHQSAIRIQVKVSVSRVIESGWSLHN